MARPRARAIVFPSVNMPLVPVRNLGVYVSFASRPRALACDRCHFVPTTTLKAHLIVDYGVELDFDHKCFM